MDDLIDDAAPRAITPQGQNGHGDALVDQGGGRRKRAHGQPDCAAPQAKRQAIDGTAAATQPIGPAPAGQESAELHRAPKGRNRRNGRGQRQTPIPAAPQRPASSSAPVRASQHTPAESEEARTPSPSSTAVSTTPPLTEIEGQPKRADGQLERALDREEASPLTPEQASERSPPPAEICREIIVLQRRRRFCIKMQSRIDRGLDAALARSLGYRTDLPKREGTQIFERVRALRRAVVADDRLVELSAEERAVIAEWLPIILQTENSRVGWDHQRQDVEASMRSLARQLPVWPWAANISGFGPLGLAVIVGEACGPSAPELGDFRSHQNLCKRLAIGIVDGHRQGSPGKAATADDWRREGYSPQRRSEIWTVLDYSLRAQQWRNETGARGVYGAIYERQVKEYEARDWPHPKKAAARYMAKALIRDLWREWRRCRTGAPWTQEPERRVVNG